MGMVFLWKIFYFYLIGSSFKEVVRFFSFEIFYGRVIVIFLLFFKSYDILLDVVEEVILKFKDYWIVMVESKEIVNYWKK